MPYCILASSQTSHIYQELQKLTAQRDEFVGSGCHGAHNSTEIILRAITSTGQPGSVTSSFILMHFLISPFSVLNVDVLDSATGRASGLLKCCCSSPKRTLSNVK